MVGDFVLDAVDLARLMVCARSAVFKGSEGPVKTSPAPTSLSGTCEPCVLAEAADVRLDGGVGLSYHRFSSQLS